MTASWTSVPIRAQSESKPDTDLLTEVSQASEAGQHQRAVDLASRVIQSDPKRATAYYLRGRGHFCLGKIQESLDDFNKFVELEPAAEVHLWERGITDYFAGKFAEGARQFEQYQTYQSEDVENAVWHVLCNARVMGFPAASEKILPVRNDPRVPMRQVYNLFRETATPEDVTQAADIGVNEKIRRSQRFYAHQYLGVYYDARGEKAKALEHLEEAVKLRENHYMWEVARVHLEHLKQQK
jgi:lipoprotein NlpI